MVLQFVDINKERLFFVLIFDVLDLGLLFYYGVINFGV